MRVVQAEESHVDQIRELFTEVYAEDYPYKQFFDAGWLRKSVYSDHIVMFVALGEKDEVLGSSSVVLDVGRHSDLIGEFGRLAVHPSAQGRGVGQLLMKARVDVARSRLHGALVEARSAHPFSQKIAFKSGFRPVGFLPKKHQLRAEESVLLGLQHFGAALSLRRNDPRVIPEVKAIAHVALENCGIADDVIVDDEAAAFPCSEEFAVEALTEDNMVPLLRIERGRTRNREVFGPTTVQHGFFKINEAAVQYLVARREKGGDVAGAIGFVVDPNEHIMKIVELVLAHEEAARPLLSQALSTADESSPRYAEIDVRCDACRLQRTLVEFGFVPCAYVPAMVFAEVERVDVVRLCRLRSDAKETCEVEPEARSIAEVVRASLRKHDISPELREAWQRHTILTGTSEEQQEMLLSACSLDEQAPGAVLFKRGSRQEAVHFILEGEVAITSSRGEVSALRAGQVLGETGAVSDDLHTASARTKSRTVLARIPLDVLTRLTRRRPDIGVLIYRNLARHLATKLRSL